MSWLLVLLTAGGALYFLLNARNQSRKRFDEILEREAAEQRRSGGAAKAPDKKKDRASTAPGLRKDV